ncbi:hypothetical protein A2U01_0097348, partial [Trifolium medium]|nr:hypothetical protein [Trifolium medium]
MGQEFCQFRQHLNRGNWPISDLVATLLLPHGGFEYNDDNPPKPL